MSALSDEDRFIIAADIRAVVEAVLEHYGKLSRNDTAQKAPSPKYAKLASLWAKHRNEQSPVVVNLAPDTIDVLDAVAAALLDIHAAVACLPLLIYKPKTPPKAEVS